MLIRACFSAVVAATLVGSLAQAQERRLFGRPNCPPSDCVPCPPSTAPTDPSAPAPSINQPPANNAFQEALASAGEGGTQPVASYMPGFFGDILGGSMTTVVILPLDGLIRTNVLIPNPSQIGGYKISENESPRPQNRFFYNYNFYGNINISPEPTFPLPMLQLNRHVIGFEKTLGEDASIGMRLPFLSLAGDPGLQSIFTGDISIILKYALFNDPPAGNVFSVGLVISVPSGGTPVFRDLTTQGGGRRTLVADRLYPVILQPCFGYIYNITDDLYLHGFHSVSVPTDSNDVTFMANDVGLGYWLYRNPEGRLKGIIPTFEVHINTPFDHRVVGPVTMQDQVNLTAGCHVAFSRCVLGGAVGIPLNGPNQIEALASFNMHF